MVGNNLECALKKLTEQKSEGLRDQGAVCPGGKGTEECITVQERPLS